MKLILISALLIVSALKLSVVLSATEIVFSLDSSDSSSKLRFVNSSSTEISFIDSSGNFSLKGGIRLDSAGIKSTASQDLIIDGSAGIGTVSPLGSLDVKGNILYGTESVTLLSDWISTDEINLLLPGEQSGGLIKSPSGSHFTVGVFGDDANDSFAVLVDSDFNGVLDKKTISVRCDGKVSIGNVTPAYELDVLGSIRASSPTYGIFAEDSDDGSLAYLGLENYAVYGYCPESGTVNSITCRIQAGNAGQDLSLCYLAYRSSGGINFGLYCSIPDISSSIAGEFTLYDSAGLGNTNAYAALAKKSGSTYYGAYLKADYTGTGYGCYAYGNTWDFYAAGSGTNYGPFTGSHDAMLHPSVPEKNLYGMIVSTSGKTLFNPADLSYTICEVCLADQDYCDRVFGVFDRTVNETGMQGIPFSGMERFCIVNALGEGKVWVTDRNGPLKNGSLITTSSIPGYGMLQKSRERHSYTLGKVIESVFWENITEYISENGIKFSLINGKIVNSAGQEYSEAVFGRIYHCYLISCVYYSG